MCIIFAYTVYIGMYCVRMCVCASGAHSLLGIEY